MPHRKNLAVAQKSWARPDYMTDQRYLAPDDCAIGQQHASYRASLAAAMAKHPYAAGAAAALGRALLLAIFVRLASVVL
jgi:hypothetical protein